jgi:hypothetical protein
MELEQVSPSIEYGDEFNGNRTVISLGSITVTTDKGPDVLDPMMSLITELIEQMVEDDVMPFIEGDVEDDDLLD